MCERLGHQLARAAKPLVKELFKWQFTRNRRPELFDPNFNYDKLFSGIAAKCFSRSPVHFDQDEKQDFIFDVLNQILTPETIKKAEPGKDPISYFGGMFQMRMMTALKNRVTRELKRKRQNPGDDRTQDEFLEQSGPTVNPHDDVDLKALTRDLINFLAKKTEGKYYVPIFQGLLTGKSNKEVAQELGVSPPIVTRYLQRMQQAIIEFANKTDNDTLLRVMEEVMKTKKHSRTPLGSDPLYDNLTTVFKKYDKVRRTSSRAPAGDITKITVDSREDMLNHENLASLILDDQTTQATIDTNAQDFLAWQDVQDELIEDNNQLIGLRVNSSDVPTLKTR